MLQFSCPSLIISYLRPHNGGDKRFFKKAMSSYSCFHLFQDHGIEPDALLNYLTTVNRGFSGPTDGKTLQELVEMVGVS